MPEFKANFIEKIQRTSSIVSFRFKPQGAIDFLSGQFLKVMFDAGNKKNNILNKYLSFSCAPGQDYFEITKRLSQSDFSKKLTSLQKKDEILFAGPLGKCVLCKSDKKICFLVGGIGITPIISIIEDVLAKKLDTNIILFYSNRNLEEIAFKKELDDWSNQNNNIKIIYTITDCESKDEKCFHGQISQDLVSKNAGDITSRKIFIFGPPKMVEAMKTLADELGCQPEQVITESFVGY
ncbi:MAG: FAD-dependent oxidoreductase [Candidatus Omnitrophota bacterium]